MQSEFLIDVTIQIFVLMGSLGFIGFKVQRFDIGLGRPHTCIVAFEIEKSKT
jgi:hypothetical protein